MGDHDSILSAAAQGDDKALEVLVRAYHDRVYRYGIRVCRDRFDTEDAVQEAFIRLARRSDVMRDPGALSWLMTVVRNICRRLFRVFLRAHPQLKSQTEDGDLDDGTTLSHQVTEDAETALERWRLVRMVHQAIASLERPYREVLVLRDVEGLTGDEVCGALGLSEAAMKSRLHRARQMVRERVTESSGSHRGLN
jgi:RNA polymerase sigma-70 factor, ECF subfamily